MYEIKKRFGKNIRFLRGGWERNILKSALRDTPKEIRDEVKRIQKELGSGGGYVLSQQMDYEGSTGGKRGCVRGEVKLDSETH